MIVKMFSRGEDDEALFATIETGQWVKVRGSVQEDDYSHDLTITAKGIQQVEHASRQEYKSDR